MNKRKKKTDFVKKRLDLKFQDCENYHDACKDVIGETMEYFEIQYITAFNHVKKAVGEMLEINPLNKMYIDRVKDIKAYLKKRDEEFDPNKASEYKVMFAKYYPDSSCFEDHIKSVRPSKIQKPTDSADKYLLDQYSFYMEHKAKVTPFNMPGGFTTAMHTVKNNKERLRKLGVKI